MKQQLPESLLTTLQGVPGFDRDAFVQVHASGDLVTSVRLNPAKPTAAFGKLPINGEVPWCPSGRYLSSRPSFTFDPVFHGGAYYVQEASSMFLDHIVRQLFPTVPPLHVLDLCAAPGGKSTLLATALPESLVVSNEVIKTRAGILHENIAKWGSPNVVVTSNDPTDFKKVPGFFDLVVVDAPCSGSGLFRKDPDAIIEWSEANVELCSMRQQRIVADAVPAMASAGYLIYSTCSYSPQEDEAVCDWIVDTLGLEAVGVDTDPAWGIVETVSPKHKVKGFRFYPDKVEGEGFFVACFRQAVDVEPYYPVTSRILLSSKQAVAIASPYLQHSEELVFVSQGEYVIAFLKKYEEAVHTLSKNLYCKKLGTAIGSIKGKDLVPHHELALSPLLSADIPLVTLDKSDALKYLRRQDFTLEKAVKGWSLMVYEDIKLGWAKVLPNRVNNYYPLNWRILKQ